MMWLLLFIVALMPVMVINARINKQMLCKIRVLMKRQCPAARNILSYRIITFEVWIECEDFIGLTL